MSDAGGGWQPPPNRPGGWGQPIGAPPGGAPPPAPTGPTTDPLAIVSLALGVLSLLSCACVTFAPTLFAMTAVLGLAITAAVLGFVSLWNIRKRPETHRGRGLAIAGIVLPILGTVVAAPVVGPFLTLVLAALLGFSGRLGP